jgi:hypothetical protein
MTQNEIKNLPDDEYYKYVFPHNLKVAEIHQGSGFGEIAL